MKISQRQLRRIIMEELAAEKRQKQIAESRRIRRSGRQQLAEGTAGNPLQITSEYLNSLIKEEYAAFQRRQQLAESRVRQRVAQRRRRR